MHADGHGNWASGDADPEGDGRGSYLSCWTVEEGAPGAA